jgi:hypothetical protein
VIFFRRKIKLETKMVKACRSLSLILLLLALALLLLLGGATGGKAGRQQQEATKRRHSFSVTGAIDKAAARVHVSRNGAPVGERPLGTVLHGLRLHVHAKGVGGGVGDQLLVYLKLDFQATADPGVHFEVSIGTIYKRDSPFIH